MSRIRFDISAHGFGHASQCVPLIKALAAQGHKITIMSALPAQHWRERGLDVETATGIYTPDWPMDGFFKVNRKAGYELYSRFHEDFAEHVRDYAGQLKAAKTDLVISNISYLAPAAAAEAGIPSLTFSSINWAAVWEFIFGKDGESGRHHALMLGSYRKSTTFARLEPGVPMADIPQAVTIAPYCTMGTNRREELLAHYRLRPDTRLVVLGFGGLDPGLSLPETVPPGQFWLLPRRWKPIPQSAWIDDASISYHDLLASSDMLITKAGYGSFTEAGCMGVPTLCLSREDWPETPYLVDWLKRHTRCLEIPFADFSFADTGRYFEALMEQPQRQKAEPTGLEKLIALATALL